MLWTTNIRKVLCSERWGTVLVKYELRVAESSGFIRILAESSQIAVSAHARSSCHKNVQFTMWNRYCKQVHAFIETLTFHKVAKCLRCGEIFSGHFVQISLKESGKSSNIRRSDENWRLRPHTPAGAQGRIKALRSPRPKYFVGPHYTYNTINHPSSNHPSNSKI